MVHGNNRSGGTNSTCGQAVHGLTTHTHNPHSLPYTPKHRCQHSSPPTCITARAAASLIAESVRRTRSAAGAGATTAAAAAGGACASAFGVAAAAETAAVGVSAPVLSAAACWPGASAPAAAPSVCRCTPMQCKQSNNTRWLACQPCLMCLRGATLLHCFSRAKV